MKHLFWACRSAPKRQCCI